jgi:hypothetical protein
MLQQANHFQIQVPIRQMCQVFNRSFFQVHYLQISQHLNLLINHQRYRQDSQRFNQLKLLLVNLSLYLQTSQRIDHQNNLFALQLLSHPNSRLENLLKILATNQQ